MRPESITCGRTVMLAPASTAPAAACPASVHTTSWFSPPVSISPVTSSARLPAPVRVPASLPLSHTCMSAGASLNVSTTRSPRETARSLVNALLNQSLSAPPASAGRAAPSAEKPWLQPSRSPSPAAAARTCQPPSSASAVRSVRPWQPAAEQSSASAQRRKQGCQCVSFHSKPP